MPKVQRHRTAIGRTQLSRPLQIAMRSGLLHEKTTFLDYGCGRGDDLRRVRATGAKVSGWDPVHRPRGSRERAQIVNLGYVVNVIEDPLERAETLRQAWQLASQVLLISARLRIEARDLTAEDFGDGLLTRRGTFQKFYTHNELREWICETLGVPVVAAAPGIFFVFRQEEAQERFNLSRLRRNRIAQERRADALFESHRELLDPILQFYLERGRLPHPEEWPETEGVVSALGSMRRAFAVLRRVTDPEILDSARKQRYQELLIQLALSRFRGRPQFSRLPRELRFDVRDYCSSYKSACECADRLLFTAGDAKQVSKAMLLSPVGKRTGNALYVHSDAIPDLPPVLRVYEGCAREFIGEVEDATCVKIHRDKPAVSYLAYPDFDRDPHPTLHWSLHVPLSGGEVREFHYGASENPPILHRKELFLSPADPRHARFRRLTLQEERWGLFEEPEQIGTRQGWAETLRRRGVHLRGHRLIRRKETE
jgi:DNA phosphorothioation-associated putative methyltransferase